MKNYIDLIAINLLSIAVALAMYLYFEGKPEVPIAILATGISLSFGIRQYKIENDKIFKELFQSFNEKYDQKFNDRLNIIISKYTSASKDVEIDDHSLIIDYLNFCAEEYLWYKKGRISSDVWKAWECGMVYYFKTNAFKKVISIERNQQLSYYGLFKKIKL